MLLDKEADGRTTSLPSLHRTVRPVCVPGLSAPTSSPDLSPTLGVIDGFRWCVLGWKSILEASFSLRLSIVGFCVWLGIRQFRKVERHFVDIT
jgi:hypothetical protein